MAARGSLLLRQKIIKNNQATPNVSGRRVRWAGRCCRRLDALKAGQRGRPRLSRTASPRPPTGHVLRVFSPVPRSTACSLQPATPMSHLPQRTKDQRPRRDTTTHDHSPFRIFGRPGKSFYAFLFRLFRQPSGSGWGPGSRGAPVIPEPTTDMCHPFIVHKSR